MPTNSLGLDVVAMAEMVALVTILVLAEVTVLVLVVVTVLV